MMYPQKRTKIPMLSVMVKSMLIVLLAFPACTGNNNRLSQEEKTNDTLQSTSTPDSVAMNIGSDTLLIQPGKAIGRFQLDDDVEEVKLFDRLGKPDSGDAAMCKSWAMWYWTDSARNSSNEFDVFSSCDPDLDMRKSIQVLRLSGAKFMTDLGISEASTKADIQEMFPEIMAVEGFSTPDGKSVFLTDDREAGIAFEFAAAGDTAVVSAVIVHQPGKPLTDSYLPLYTKKDSGSL